MKKVQNLQALTPEQLFQELDDSQSEKVLGAANYSAPTPTTANSSAEGLRAYYAYHVAQQGWGYGGLGPLRRERQ